MFNLGLKRLIDVFSFYFNEHQDHRVADVKKKHNFTFQVTRISLLRLIGETKYHFRSFTSIRDYTIFSKDHL